MNEQGVIKVKFKVATDVVPGTMAFVVGLRDKSGKTATAKSTVDVVATKSAENKIAQAHAKNGQSLPQPV